MYIHRYYRGHGSKHAHVRAGDVMWLIPWQRARLGVARGCPCAHRAILSPCPLEQGCNAAG